MSHRSRLTAERSRLSQPARQPLTFPNMQRREQPKQIQCGLDGLVPILMQQGMKPEIGVGVNEDKTLVVIMATLGPLQIPMLFSAEQIRTIILPYIDQALDAVDPPALESTDPDRDAELLAESARALKGDWEDDEDDDLVPVTADAATDSPID
jgi:hypothetical protein